MVSEKKENSGRHKFKPQLDWINVRVCFLSSCLENFDQLTINRLVALRPASSSTLHDLRQMNDSEIKKNEKKKMLSLTEFKTAGT